MLTSEGGGQGVGRDASRWVRRAMWGTAATGIGVLTATGLAAASPTVRAEAHRLRRFARPLQADGGVAVPPPLPPGRCITVARRGELFVRETDGAGPAVLLLHGWGATADVNFFTVYSTLPAYRVVALDHRSHGRGPRPSVPFTLEDCADDAADLLAALGIDRAVVVGYSMGGAIALLLARRHPERVSGLVLAATALEFSADARDRALWRGLTMVEATFRHGAGDGVVQRLLRETVEKDPSLDAYRTWLAGEFRRGHVPGLIEAGHALQRFDARPHAAGIHQPAAVILTTADRLVLPRKQRALAAALGAEVFEIDADHDGAIACGPVFGSILRAAIGHVVHRARRQGDGGPG